MKQKLISMSLIAMATLFSLNVPAQGGHGGGGTTTYSTTAKLNNCNFSTAPTAAPVTAAFAVANRTSSVGTATATCSNSGGAVISSPASYSTTWSPTTWTVTIAEASASCAISSAPRGVTVINNGNVATAKGSSFPATVKFNCTTPGLGNVPGQVDITHP